MEITIKGEPKEIAALVLEIQERQKQEGWICLSDNPQHAEGPVYDNKITVTSVRYKDTGEEVPRRIGSGVGA